MKTSSVNNPNSTNKYDNDQQQYLNRLIHGLAGRDKG